MASRVERPPQTRRRPHGPHPAPGHLAGGRSLPPPDRPAGRLLFGIRPDQVPDPDRGGVLHRPLRTAASAAQRVRPGALRCAAGDLPQFHPTGGPAGQGRRAGHQPRRQGRGVHPQGGVRGAGVEAVQGVHPLRPDLPGHQQHRASACDEGGVAGGARAGAARRGGRPGAEGPRLEAGADAGPHPRPAGIAHEPRQGALRVRGKARGPAGADSACAVFGQVRGGHRQLQRPRGRFPPDRLAGVRRPAGQRNPGAFQVAHDHPDRALRQPGRLLRQPAPDQHDPDRPRPGRPPPCPTR